MPLWVRPHLIPPVTTTAPLNVASVVEWGVTDAGQPGGGDLFVATVPYVPGAWMVSSEIVTRPAVPPPPSRRTAACGDNATTQSCQTYVAGLHLRQLETYQPASRYWPLQWFETAIYLAAALLLAGLCFLRIRRGRPAGSDGRRGPEQPFVLHSRQGGRDLGNENQAYRTDRANR